MFGAHTPEDRPNPSVGRLHHWLTATQVPSSQVAGHSFRLRRLSDPVNTGPLERRLAR